MFNFNRILLIAGIIAAGLLLGGTLVRLQQLARQDPARSAIRTEPPQDRHAAVSSIPESKISSDLPTNRRETKPSAPLTKKESSVSAAEPARSMPEIAAIAAPIVTPAASGTTSVSASASSTAAILAAPPMPPLDEEAIFSAVVKIECASEDRKGTTVGSGFALPHGVIVTAAHLIEDAGSDACRVIFPDHRGPSHYFVGKLEDRETVRKRYDEEGLDVAFIFMPLLAAYPEAHAIFPDHYPFIPYPVCRDPVLIGDQILRFGYPGNYQGNSYLDMARGQVLVYADIQGIKQELSEDQSYVYKTPIFGYTKNQSAMHSYLVSRVASFAGDSGGLGFDATRQCIIGPDHGGTSGGGAGENLSIFTVLDWEGVRSILP